MSYYDEDFYEEPSEFDQQISEFKEFLTNSVKEEIKAEMKRLRAENADLQEFKKQKQEIENEVRRMKHQAQLDKEEATRIAMKARLSELMGGFEVEMWTAEYYYMDSRKCNRCDEKRRIYFKTPLGRDSSEECTCSGRIRVYEPVKNVMYKISTRRDWGTIKDAWFYYTLKTDGDYDSAERKYDGSAEQLYVPGQTTYEEVEKNNYKRVYFDSKEACQKYCVWKMEKDAGLPVF